MSFKLRIVTPNTTAEIDDVDALNITTLAGQITILPNHFPLLSGIGTTKVKITKNKEEMVAFANEGVINVLEKEVTLILNAFEFRDQIDLERAKASYKRAFERINNHESSINISRAEASLKRAMTRIDICEN